MTLYVICVSVRGIVEAPEILNDRDEALTLARERLSTTDPETDSVGLYLYDKLGVVEINTASGEET
jgi:hypothetical protein